MSFLFLSKLSLLCQGLALQLRDLQILLFDGVQQIRVLVMLVVRLGPPPPSYPVNVLVVPVEHPGHPGQPVEAVVLVGGGTGGGRGRRREGQTAAQTGSSGPSVSDGRQSAAVVVNHRVRPRAGGTVQTGHLIREMSEHCSVHHVVVG